MGMERLLASNLRRFVLLIEEPELYLSPHTQRHLFRRLRELAQRGNQILYSTHAPVFLSVDKIEELALVRHTSRDGTTLLQPEPLAEAEAFRVLSEFDSDRAELFLARSVLLVEGRTEKMTFPYVFEALEAEPDKEGVLILECGGKGNMPLFARICNACEIPYVIVHDRDAPAGERPVESERVVNRQIQEVAGKRRVIVLTPDFEAVAGMRTGGRGRKPRKAVRRFSAGNGDGPQPLRTAAEEVRRAARAVVSRWPPRLRAPWAEIDRACDSSSSGSGASSGGSPPLRWASACASSQSASCGVRRSSGPWGDAPGGGS